MRKTLATLFAAFILIGTAGPALAIGTTVPDDPIVYCNDAPATGPAGCVPVECKDTIDRLLGGYAARVALRDTTIASQQSRIDRQAKIIERLRHRLATR